MKERFFSITKAAIIFILFLLNPVQIHSETVSPAPPEVKVVVKLKKKLTARSMMAVLKDTQNTTFVGGISNTDLMVVKTTNPKDAIQKFKGNPEVVSASNMPKMRAFLIPNDPLFSNQWGLTNIKAPAAWDIINNVAVATSTIKIAVVDSGVDRNHPDLVGKISSNDWILCDWHDINIKDYVECRPDPTGTDATGHGTHVAGIIGANTNNNLGIAGTAWGVKFMPIRVLDKNNSGDFDVVMEAITWAADHGARVINLSIGAHQADITSDVMGAMQNVIDAAWRRGAILVSAAGNCGRANNTGNAECALTTGQIISNTRVYPAAANHVISVAALTQNNTLASYSEHNDATNPNIGNWIAVAAPGGEGDVGIVSTFPGSQYKTIPGTSMAAPFVSAVAALILAQNPALTNDQIRDIMFNTANNTVAVGSTIHGLIDANSAVNAATLIATVSPTVFPTVNPTVTKNPTPSVSPNPSVTAVPSIPTAPTVTPFPLVSPRLMKTRPSPYPAGPYCPNI